MCNLYSQTKSQDAMRHVFDDMNEEDENFEDLVGNLQPTQAFSPTMKRQSSAMVRTAVGN